MEQTVAMHADSSGNTPATDADADLMLRLQRDDLALNLIMDRWAGRVASFIYKMTGNQAITADLAQETFVKVYQARMRYRPSGSFNSYLFGIAANLVKNQQRWTKRHPTVSLDDPQGDANDIPNTAAEDASDPRSAAEARESVRAVYEAIFSLPIDLREAITLSVDEGMSHDEIAKALGCTAKAVETRIYRARQILKAKLTGLSRHS